MARGGQGYQYQSQSQQQQQGQSQNQNQSYPASPGEASQTRWWDRIMQQYQLGFIMDELTFLVTNTGHVLSFVNLALVRRRLQRAETRAAHVHPCFVLAVLAMARLMKSSTVEGGQRGVAEAMRLLAEANACYAEAVNAGWADWRVAQAGVVLALFESSAHPNHSAAREADALRALDALLRTLNLPAADAADADVVSFAPHTVPSVIIDSPLDDYQLRERRCACLTLPSYGSGEGSGGGAGEGGGSEGLGDGMGTGLGGVGRAREADLHATRTAELPWDPAWGADEVRREEVRRVCWAALTLVSEYVARCEAFEEEPPVFYICEPANWALLFPGEVLDRRAGAFLAPDGLAAKESVWGLYCRAMLLWNFCNRFRTPSQAEQRGAQAHEAFLEAQALEDALNAHRCNLDTAVIYTTREYVHNTRMLVAQALRAFNGLGMGGGGAGGGGGRGMGRGMGMFKRKQAEDWLFYEDQVIRRVNALIHQLPNVPAHQLSRRPYRINWFINQLAICLVLWTHDPTLDDALKLAKAILGPIDVLNAMWPCAAIRARSDALRQQLVQACTARNLDLPVSPAANTAAAFGPAR